MSAAVKLAKRMASQLGLEVHRKPKAGGCDASPINGQLFSPWTTDEVFKNQFDTIKPLTLISADRCYVLYTLASQAARLDGHWYECGVYKGGSAILLSKLMAEKREHEQSELHLFDTFDGMPEPDQSKDLHEKGDFSDTSVDIVLDRVMTVAPNPSVVHFHKGLIPDTFAGLEDHSIAFSHIDVDLYQSVIACCQFIYPRTQSGGFMVFDDYGFPTCPGARQAVDEFFFDKREIPLVLPTGQAVVFRA